MRCFALRLVVALLTFAVGVGVAASWNALVAAPAQTQDVPAPSYPSTPLMAAEAYEPAHPCGCATTKEAFAELYASMPHSGGRVIYGGLLQGRAISKPQPAYPPAARAAGVSGPVVVEIIVGEDGKVLAALPLSGHPLLQPAATEAACHIRYSPTLVSGQPVKVAGTITYNFVLQ